MNELQTDKQQQKHQTTRNVAHSTGSRKYADPRIHFHFVVSVTCFAVNISIGLRIFANVRGKLLLLLSLWSKHDQPK